MKPVRPGDRGPAVEDIQRRLRSLGYELGRAGIDGIFLGATAEAVRSFQAEAGLEPDGLIDDLTWSALVDATFQVGDRMLYLRVPHFHGRDVTLLQQALNVLGFACGRVDGIFGAFTERAVREFQRNAGLPADGIVGADTVKALLALRHVWEGKEPRSHSAAHLGFARAAEVLSRVPFSVGGLDAVGERIAERIVNLALATSEDARVSLAASTDGPSEGGFSLRLAGSGTASAVRGRPVVTLSGEAFPTRLFAAISSAGPARADIVVEFGDVAAADERREQSVAIEVLDAVCVVFQ